MKTRRPASDVTREVEAVVAGSQIEVVAVSTSLVTAKPGDEGPSMNARESESEEDKGGHEHCFVREWLLLRGVPLKEEENGGGRKPRGQGMGKIKWRKSQARQ